jgi:hypothetical protein
VSLAHRAGDKFTDAVRIESMALMHGQNDKVNRPGIQIFPGDRFVTKDEKIKWKAVRHL